MPKSRVFIVSVLVVVALTRSSGAPVQAQADSPIDFGRRALDEALAARGLKAAVEIKVTGTGDPESYAIAFAPGGGARISAPDANGAMYGALELAERVRRQGTESPPRHRGWLPAIPSSATAAGTSS